MNFSPSKITISSDNTDYMSVSKRCQLRSIEAQQRRLVKLYTGGSLPEDVLGEESERLRVQRERLERELRRL